MNQSYWLDRQAAKQYAPLSSDQHVHTLIVGAGLTGLTTAYYLSAQTTNIAVVEADTIGYGTSGRNTGKISFQHGAIYHKLIQTHGIEAAKAYYTAQQEAMESIHAIICEHHFTLHYERCDAFLYTNQSDNIEIIRQEYEAYQNLGIPAQYCEQSGFPIPFLAGIRINDQAGYDPYAYMLGLSDVLDARGIALYEHSPVNVVEKDGSGWKVSVNNHTIYAQNIVSATMTPILDGFSFFFAKTYPSLSHLALLEVSHPLQREMLYCIDDPMRSYHGIQANQLLCGGYAHGAGEEDAQAYQAWLQSLYQTWDTQPSKWVWDSQDLISYDHLPLIGSLSDTHPNFLIACGYGKWGNTNANVAAKLLCAILLHQESPYAELFSPSRLTAFTKGKCLRMNIKTAMTLLKSQFPAVSDAPLQVQEGKCILIEGHPYGMYLDEHNELYIVDIRCPHMGCVCSFNQVDHTWDCPCHGSRFGYDGRIIKGPAQSALHEHHDNQHNHVDPKLFISKTKHS